MRRLCVDRTKSVLCNDLQTGKYENGFQKYVRSTTKLEQTWHRRHFIFCPHCKVEIRIKFCHQSSRTHSLLNHPSTKERAPSRATMCAARASTCSSNSSKTKIYNKWHLTRAFISALFWFWLSIFYTKEANTCCAFTYISNLLLRTWVIWQKPYTNHICFGRVPLWVVHALAENVYPDLRAWYNDFKEKSPR